MAKKTLPVIRIISQSESRLHLVDRDKFVIGRSPDVEILLLSASISRKHLSVEVRDNSLIIEDMGSSNGSFLNDMRLDPGKKYPVPLLTPIRLGNNGDVVTIDLMERPMEFDQYHSYLPKFNFDLQGLLEQIVKEANSRADVIMKEAQSKADHYVTQAQVQAQGIIQKVRVQEDSALDIAQSKAQQVIKDAEKTASEALEKSRQMAQAEADSIRQTAHQEADSTVNKRLEQLRIDIQNQHDQAMEKARGDAEREYRMKSEETEGRLRELSQQIKGKAQAEADEILQAAHKEASRVKEAGVQEFEKLRTEGQARVQTLLTEAEQQAEKIIEQARDGAERMRKTAQADYDGALEKTKDVQKKVQSLVSEAEQQAEKIMLHAREAAEKLRQTSRLDFDEAVARSKAHNQELMQNGEAEANQLVENARKRAQFIIENQEKESAFILQELRNRIEMEARKEGQKLLREAEDEIEAKKSEARQAYEAAQLKQAQLDEKLALLNKELESAEQSKKHLLTQSQDLQGEISRLKDENKRQMTLNEKLDELTKQIQGLELQRAQLGEKNAKMESELDLLRKKTFEELELRRQAEERRILEMASHKAREFSVRIEKIILQEINHMLPLALNSSQVNAVSKTLTEELISLFHFESAKHSEAISMQKQDRNVTPSFMKKPIFRIGVVTAMIAGGFYLYQESHKAVEKQEKFTEALIEKQKEDAKFKPVMTDEFQATYTDNVIYKNRYTQIKMDSGIQDNWALNLNEFFLQELRLSEDNMVRFIGIEAAMVKKLATLRESLDSKYYEEGIARMREAEKTEIEKIMALLKTPQNYERLRLREKVFLSQVSTVETRVPAQDAMAKPAAADDAASDAAATAGSRTPQSLGEPIPEPRLGRPSPPIPRAANPHRNNRRR